MPSSSTCNESSPGTLAHFFIISLRIRQIPLIDQRIVEDIGCFAGHRTPRLGSDDHSKDGKVVPVGVCQITQSMTIISLTHLETCTSCNGPGLNVSCGTALDILLMISRSGASALLALFISLGTAEVAPGILSDLMKAPISAPCCQPVPLSTHIRRQGSLPSGHPLNSGGNLAQLFP